MSGGKKAIQKVNGNVLILNFPNGEKYEITINEKKEPEKDNIAVTEGDLKMTPIDLSTATKEPEKDNIDVTGGDLKMTPIDLGTTIKEPVKEPTKEPTKEPIKEPAKEPTKEPEKETTKEPTKEPEKETTKEPTKEPAKEPAKEPEKEPEKEPKLKTESDVAMETLGLDCSDIEIIKKKCAVLCNKYMKEALIQCPSQIFKSDRFDIFGYFFERDVDIIGRLIQYENIPMIAKLFDLMDIELRHRWMNYMLDDENKKLKIFQYLYECGHSAHKSAIKDCIDKGNVKLLKFLISKNHFSEKYLHDLFVRSVKNNLYDNVQCFRSVRIKETENVTAVVNAAVQKGQYSMIQLVREMFPSWSWSITAAINYDDVTVAKILLSAGCRPSVSNFKNAESLKKKEFLQAFNYYGYHLVEDSVVHSDDSCLHKLVKDSQALNQKIMDAFTKHSE